MPDCETSAGSSGSADLGACDFSCPECARPWADCVCTDSPVCWICLEASGELLRGCACRGTAGYVHVTCMVKANRYRTIDHDQCPTCEQRFVGALSMALAEARVREIRASRSDMSIEATSNLASACLEQGRYDEALGHYRNVLRHGLRRFGHNHPDVAMTYGNMGCVYDSMGDFPKALECHNRDLEIKLRVFGPEHLLVADTKNK